MNKSKLFWRFLEILPGFGTLTFLIWPILFSFTIPALVAYYVLLFDLYWIYKVFVMSFHLIWGYRALKKGLRTDWQKKLNELPSFDPENSAVYQAVILTTYKEELDTLIPSVQSILDSHYPANKIIFVLATEERDLPRAKLVAQALKVQFSQKFYTFLVTLHPDNLPGEVKAKGANAKWAAKELKKFLDQKKIAYENVLVTTADADTQFHPQYFSALTLSYLSGPDKIHRSFQPIALYSNNIWQAAAISRILAFGSSFWQIIESTRPWRLINFSTHSMSFKTLEAMDFWDTTVVNEDSRQYWRAFFAFSGNHTVVPIFVPVYMDAVLAPSFKQTLGNLYKQRRRWAYGIEHFPYVVTQSIQHKEIPLWSKLIRIYRLLEGNFSWATSSLTIAFFGWLPFIFNSSFKTSVLSYNLPLFARNLLILTWVGLIISALISTLLLPPRPRGYHKLKFIEMLAQWVLIPISAIFFGSLPAIDAQLRLMMGRYLAFQVTTKNQSEVLEKNILLG